MEQRSKPAREMVVREFPPISKYRVRLVEQPETQAQTLDIREYISSDTFEGFTRRGIRLTDKAQIDLLQDILKEVIERSGFGSKA